MNFMGNDACIYFEVNPDANLDYIRTRIIGEFSIRDIPDYCLEEKEQGATHEVDNPYRYWSPGYPRGPWGYLSSVLMLLIQRPEVKRVWYGGDCSGTKIIDEDFILKMSAAYMKMGKENDPEKYNPEGL